MHDRARLVVEKRPGSALGPPATDKRALLQCCENEFSCRCCSARLDDEQITIGKPDIGEVARDAVHDLAALNPIAGKRDLFIACYDRHALGEHAVHHLFLYQRSRQARNDLEYVIVIDEALHLWQARANNIEHQPLLSMLQSMVREFGIGLIVATTSLQVIDPILKANVFAQIAMNMTNHFESSEVARTFGLTTEEQAYFSAKLQRGECVIKLADGWRYPILASFPADHESKDVRDEEWHTALERINTITPTEPVAESVAAREGIAGTEQPTPSRESAPSSSPPARVAPAVEQDLSSNTKKIPPNAIRRVALNRYAAALLADAGDHPFTLTTTAYDRCGMHWTQGDRAKQLDIKLGLLEAHTVKTGAGRGKTGSALRVTPAGWQWLGRNPTKGTRGGDSAQHSFLVHELSRRITKRTIETLGTDLVIPYNTHNHQALIRVLGELAGRDLALNDGALITLECEVSAPAKTVPRNITRDAGFALTIIATLPKHLTLASRLIAHNEHVIVVDVLRLLDALHTTEER